MFPKRPWIVVLVLVLVIQSAAIVLLWNDKQDLDKKINTSAASLNSSLDSNNRLLNGELQSDFSAEKVVVDPVNSVVYLPEFKIKLPLNTVTKTIAYSLRTDLSDNETQEADVTSTRYVAPEKTTVINCSDFVRLKVEAKPQTYNPNEKTVVSIPLNGNQTLQVYEAINQKECAASWSRTISPDTVAQQFKSASTY